MAGYWPLGGEVMQCVCSVCSNSTITVIIVLNNNTVFIVVGFLTIIFPYFSV